MSFASSRHPSGRPVSTANTRRTMNGAGTQNGFTKTFIWSSEWYFLPEGVKSLRSQFMAELGRKNLQASLYWIKENVEFRLECSHDISEEVWAIFLSNIRDLIAQETGDLGDDSSGSDSDSDTEEDIESRANGTKSKKIQSRSSWEKENGTVEGLVSTADPSETTQQSHQEFPEELSRYKSRIIWEHVVYAPHIPKLDQIVPDQLLLTLEQVTRSQYIKNVDESRIYIGAFSEEEGQAAIMKLDNIRDNHEVWRYPLVKHLFYSEELEVFKVSFKYIPEVKKKFFETTILDNLQLSPLRFNYWNLPWAVTVRCAVFDNIKSRYVPFKIAKYHPASDFDNKDSGAKAWQGFTYNSFILPGKEEDNAMTRFEEKWERSRQSTSPLSQQIEEAKLGATMGAQEPETPIIEVLTTHAKDTRLWLEDQGSIGVISDGQSDEANRTQPQRQSKEAENSSPEASQFTPTDSDSASLTLDPESYPLPTRVASLIPQASDIDSPSPSHDVEQGVIMSPCSLLESNDCVPATIHPNNGPLAPQVQPNKTLLINLLDEDISMLYMGPVLEPIHNKHSSSHGPSDSCTGSAPALHTQRLQRADEVASRKFYATMNQKAPKSSQSVKSKGFKSPYAGRLEQPVSPVRPKAPVAPLPVDPTSLFVSDMASSFEKLLEPLRGFHGEVAIQADFGRILLKGIPNSLISVTDLEHNHDPEGTLNRLDDPVRAHKTIFTKVLTVLPADISFLAGLKDREDRFIWSQEHPSWEVIYEFLCVDGRRVPRRAFKVEIEAETFSCRVKIQRHFGAINVHGVKRHWDFRVSANGVDAEEDIDPDYASFAKAIKESLHIPEKLALPMLFFEVSDGFADYDILGVRVRRNTRYQGLQTNSVLKVSEVRELQLFDARGENCTTWKAVGSLAPHSNIPGPPHLKHRYFYLWHEVSISCPAADAMFKENASMELGDEATWNTRKVSGINAIQCLYLPTCEMLRQMDGVGFYNDNDIDAQAVLSQRAKAPETKEETASSDHDFW